MSEAPLLALDAVDAGYGGAPVVRDLSLHVRAGEVVALLGPNGAGKTTTLSTIAGLLTCLGGTIKLDGEDVDGVPAHKLARRGVSLVPEGRALFYGMTVREHLKLAETKGSPRRDQLIELLPELEKCLDRKAGVLSGGEQQMLTICRTLMGDPDLIMIDEPTEGLAPLIVKQVGGLMTEIARRGLAILLVEQKLSIALDISKRIYVMGHGRIVFHGPPTELKRNDAVRREWLEV
jgi:branched-chain amino acid transport system ATP-binding protein